MSWDCLWPVILLMPSFSPTQGPSWWHVHPSIKMIFSMRESGRLARDFMDWSFLPFFGGNGKPLQYSRLENPMDREACRVTVQGVTKSWMQLKRLTHTSPLLGPSWVFPRLVLGPSLTLYSLKNPDVGDLRCCYGAQSGQAVLVNCSLTTSHIIGKICLCQCS